MDLSTRLKDALKYTYQKLSISDGIVTNRFVDVEKQSLLLFGKHHVFF